MNLESTISTIIETIPHEINQAISQVSYYIPGDLRAVIRNTTSFLPTEISFMTVAQFVLYFAAASLILGVTGRLVLGKRSSLNHSLSSVMGILFIYVVTTILYTFKPWNLDLLLSPLPFATFSDHYLIIHPITRLEFPALCSELLSLIILAFLINLLDNFMPNGDHIVSWFLLRLVTILTCFALHILVNWAFHTYIPGVLEEYAPVILLITLGVFVLSGVITLILGLVIAVTNPFLGAMYSFFFSNVIGKQISKAIFTSVILCVILYLMDYFDLIVIIIHAEALLTYIPLAIITLVLWFLIGHLL